MGIIERYREFLPITDKTPLITLGEGNTPLIRADRLAREIGFRGELYFKLEGANPTGSFKDRGMVVAVAKALEEGMEMFACASTGNTAASASAYGVAVGVQVAVFVPRGGIARGKLMQIAAYGAKLIEINGNFDACQNIVKELVRKYPKIGLLNSINPYRLEGQKTAAFEIWDELYRMPDYHFIPVGNGGNITAYWMGYKEYKEHLTKHSWFNVSMEFANGVMDTLAKPLPKMMGYQAEGAAPIVRGHIIEDPQTIASAIKIGNPARWKEAVAAVSESGGRFDTVSDEEILHWHNLIPRLHPNAGCEPASAASVAGFAKALRNGEIENNEDTVVVCVLTGALWKDPETVLSRVKRRQKSLDPQLAAVEKVLKL